MGQKLIRRFAGEIQMVNKHTQRFSLLVISELQGKKEEPFSPVDWQTLKVKWFRMSTQVGDSQSWECKQGQHIEGNIHSICSKIRCAYAINPEVWLLERWRLKQSGRVAREHRHVCLPDRW